MPSITVYPVHWPRIIFDLEGAGLSDTEIAEKVGCHKSRICEFKLNEGSEPMHTLGEKILNLHYVYCLSVEAPPPKPMVRRSRDALFAAAAMSGRGAVMPLVGDAIVGVTTLPST